MGLLLVFEGFVCLLVYSPTGWRVSGTRRVSWQEVSSLLCDWPDLFVAFFSLVIFVSLVFIDSLFCVSSPLVLSLSVSSFSFTRQSCDLVFCPPWQHCVDGHCTCKPPYRCPSGGTPVCGHNGRKLNSYCQVTSWGHSLCTWGHRRNVFIKCSVLQAMALSCRTNKPSMSHFGDTCTGSFSKTPNVCDDVITASRHIFISRFSRSAEVQRLHRWRYWSGPARPARHRELWRRCGGGSGVSGAVGHGGC